MPIVFPGSPIEKYKSVGLDIAVPITIDTPHEDVLKALHESARKWMEEK